MYSNTLRILLAEDDELFRLGLRMRLEREPGLEVIAEAEDGETAVDLASQHCLSVVLMDIGLPGIGGIEACRQIKQNHPALPVLILTSRSQKSLIVRLIEAGAQGYCMKGIASETLILAIRSVAMGASWWDQTATQEIRTAFSSSSSVVSTLETIIDTTKSTVIASNHLTRREQQILALVAEGKSNQEIAKILYITPGTVRVHIHTILHKLEVPDRAQAAVLALQRKLIAKDLLSE